MTQNPARRPDSLLRRLRRLKTPATVAPCDYLTLRPSPAHLVDAQGRYQAGWYDDPAIALNVIDAAAPRAHLQSWLHVSFLAGDRFVVADIADLTRAGHTAALIVDRATGDIDEGAVRHLRKGRVLVDDHWRRFRDLTSGSFLEARGDTIAFNVLAGGVRVEGLALRVGDPFVQVTAAHDGHGAYQVWGNLELIHGAARGRFGHFALTPGARGAFDLTVGHRSRLQNWNWLSVLGRATDQTPFSMIMARDKEGALPFVDARKHALWIDGALHKLDTLAFDYDPAALAPWHIHGRSERGGPWIDLHFTPRFCRNNSHRIPLVYEVDFNQHYGAFKGRFGLGDRTWHIEDTFGLTEDSWLML